MPRSNRAGPALAHRGETLYPAILEELENPPKQLYWLGNHWPPPRRSIAVVGTRAASPYALEMAAALASDLARAGVAVVSGMARGVDSAAHRGALDAGGISVAVLAADVETPYPSGSKRLHRDLVNRGAVCSEYPGGTVPRRGLFVRRNRIVAGLSRGVVVVEAGLQSGALRTARMAREANRFVAAVPGDVTRENALGCLVLLRQGAVPVASAGEVLLELSRTEGNIPGSRQELLDALRREGTVGMLALRLGRSAVEIAAELTLLELAGAVRRGDSGVYRLQAGPPAGRPEE